MLSGSAASILQAWYQHNTTLRTLVVYRILAAHVCCKPLSHISLIHSRKPTQDFSRTPRPARHHLQARPAECGCCQLHDRQLAACLPSYPTDTCKMGRNDCLFCNHRIQTALSFTCAPCLHVDALGAMCKALHLRGFLQHLGCTSLPGTDDHQHMSA